MAGFLDKNSRIIDMILTGRGRNLLAQNKLRLVYWMPFDDEIHYDPYISQSGTMNASQLSSSIVDHIESCPVREAVCGYPTTDRSGSDYTNLIRPIFTMPQGQFYLPRMTASDGPTDAVTIETQQRKLSEVRVTTDDGGNVLERIGPIDRGYERLNTTSVIFRYQYTPGSFPNDYKSAGFLVKVFRSGTEGTIQVKERRDMNNDIAFSNDLVFYPGDDY